jgi:hypothetical protein
VSNCLLVGEAPSRTSDPRKPLVLASLAGLARLQFPQEWCATFDRVNLLQEWPGADSPFPLVKASKVASDLRPKIQKYRWVVLLGKRVARAFHPELAGRSWFQWGPIPVDDVEALQRLNMVRVGVDPETLSLGPSCVMVPHPSRCSRWWNDAKNCRKAKKFWTELAEAVICDS